MSELEQERSLQAATWSVCLLILTATIDSQVVAAIAPQIAGGLGAAKTTVTATVTAYSLAAAAVALVLGWKARQIHPGKWLVVAAGAFAVAEVVAAFAPHVVVFYLARTIAGFAGAMISALAIAALANASSYAKRGRQMSGVAISYFLAPVIGVPVGAYLTGWLGWRAVFVASAVMAVVAGTLVGAFPLPGGNISAPAEKPPSMWALVNRSTSTRMGIISAFFISGGLVGFTTFLGTWLADAFRAGANTVGSIYLVAGIGAVAGGAFGGGLADKFGKRRVAVPCSLALALLSFAVPTFTWSFTLIALIGLTAVVASLRVAPLQALVTEQVAPADRAAYVALRNATSQLGIAATVALAGRAYTGWGMIGVGLLGTVMSLGAWYCTRKIADPHEAETLVRSMWWRLARAAVVALVAVTLVIPVLLSVLVTKANTRPDERGRTDTPARYGATFEDVTFTSSDGNRLSGWFLPSGSERVTIVMTHGLFRSRYELLERGAAFWKMGYDVLLYDLRRHGKSQAEFSTAGYDERHDVLAAIDFARKKTPGNKIVLFGISMGAAATLMAAAESTDIHAIIAESSFLSFEDTTYHHVGLVRLPTFPFAPVMVWLTAWRMNFRPAAFDVRGAVSKISCPIFFIGGSKDNRMPTETVLDPLYAAARNPLKEKLVVAGATHGHAYDVSPDAYRTAVKDFLARVEGTKKSS